MPIQAIAVGFLAVASIVLATRRIILVVYGCIDEREDFSS